MNIADQESFPISGYLLLRSDSFSVYKGVDRDPFVPLLLDKEMIEDVGSTPRSVSDFYPPGWRKEAYLTYEQNCLTYRYEELLNNLDAAFLIRKIIEPHVGPHQVVHIEVAPLDRSDLFPNDQEVYQHQRHLGFDLAYPGGDFYSAIRNGLFSNPSSALVREFKSLLNGNGLFVTISDAQRYLIRFRQEVPTENKSEFWLYRLIEIIENG